MLVYRYIPTQHYHWRSDSVSFLSWVGLLAALLFGCQWALGFSAFLFPKFSPEIRALLLPFHQVSCQSWIFVWNTGLGPDQDQSIRMVQIRPDFPSG